MNGTPVAAYDGSKRSGLLTLRWKLLIRFGLAFTVTLALMGLVRTFGIPFTAFNGSYGQELDQAVANLNLIADLKKERFESWLQERKADVDCLCQDEALISSIKGMSRTIDEPGGPKSTREQLRKVLSGNARYQSAVRQLNIVLHASTGFRRLHIADAQTGIILISTEDKEVGAPVPDRQLLTDTLNSQFVETVRIGNDLKGSAPYLLISRVLADHPSDTTDHTAFAILIGYIDSSAFLKPMLYTGEYFGRTGDIILVDQEARILMSLKFPLTDGTSAEILKHQIRSEPVLRAIRGEEGAPLTRDYRGVPVLAALRHIQVTPDTGWGMVVKRDRADVLAPVWSRVLHSTIVGVVGLMAAAGIAILTANRVSMPIYDLIRTAWDLRAGNLSARAHVSGLVEAEELAATFNSMAERFEHWHKDLAEQVAARTEELRKANDQLAREKQLLAVTLRSIGDGLISTDTDGKVVSINNVAQRLTGWTEADAIGRPLEETFHIVNELTRQRCANPVHKVLATGLVCDLSDTTALVAKNGKERIIASSGAPIHDEDGKIVGVVLVFRDVTEYRLAHEALLKNEKKYRTLFDESRDGVYSVLRNGELVDANQSFLDLFGYTRQEMIGKNFVSLYVDPGDRPKFQSAIEGTGYVKDYQLRFRKKGGASLDCLLTSSVQHGDDGIVVGYHGIIRDVTEQRRAERKIREQNTLLTTVLESLTYPFYVIDANNYKIMVANSHASSGASEDAQLCYVLTHRRSEPCNSREHPCPLEEVKKTGKPFAVEHIHYDPAGNPRNVEIHAYPIFDDEGHVKQVVEFAPVISEVFRILEEQPTSSLQDFLEKRVRCFPI